jgi:hypothetical protein
MEALRHAMKIGRDNHRKRPKRRSHPVESWRHDLDTVITEGWTDYGQTNYLLKTIACYGHVFESIQGQALIDYTLRIALNCPGYEQYCRHQHDIERKVTAWVRAVEGYYWPLGTTPSRDTSQPKTTWCPSTSSRPKTPSTASVRPIPHLSRPERCPSRSRKEPRRSPKPPKSASRPSTSTSASGTLPTKRV